MHGGKGMLVSIFMRGQEGCGKKGDDGLADERLGRVSMLRRVY